MKAPRRIHLPGLLPLGLEPKFNLKATTLKSNLAPCA
jgi:hypothetical protein